MTRTVLIIAFVAALAASAASQTPSKPFHLYLQGGASLPQEDFNSMYKYGYHGGGGIGFSILPRLELVARGSYHKYSLESGTMLVVDPSDVLPAEVASFEGGDMTMIMYGAELKLNLGVMVSNPYAIAGYGQARFDREDMNYTIAGLPYTLTEEATTDNFWVLGGGLEFTRTFIEVRYHAFLDGITEETTSRLITVSFGLKL